MTTSQHLDGATLTTLVVENPENATSNEHLEACVECQRQFASWRQVADAARLWITTVPPPSEELHQRIMANLPEVKRPGSRPAAALCAVTRPEHRWRWRWLAPVAAMAVLVAVVILVLPNRSSVSDAAVLRQIRSAPTSLNARWPTSYSKETVVYEAHDGVTLSAWGYNTAYSWSTGATRTTGRLIYPELYPGHPDRPQPFVTSDGKQVYLAVNPQLLAIGAKAWVSYPVIKQPSVTWQVPLSFLRSARGPVDHLGQRTIDGSTATGYELTVPGSVLLAATPPSLQATAKTSDANIKSARVKIWLDPRSLPVALEMTYATRLAQSSEPVSVKVNTTLDYAKTPLRVTAPPAPQTAFEPSYEAAQAQISRWTLAYEVYEHQLLGR